MFSIMINFGELPSQYIHTYHQLFDAKKFIQHLDGVLNQES